MKKRIMSVLMTFVMILGCIGIMPVMKTAALSQTEVESRLNSLMNQYVGTVWSDYYYGIQCKGFANLMFYKIFNVVYIGSYDSEKYYIPSPSGAEEVGRLNFSQMTESAAKSLLQKGKPGDYIQVRRRGKSWGHSMILVSTDSNGITVFDCNSDGACGVKSYYITYSSFYSKNSAMSLYHANGYTSINHNPTGALESVTATTATVTMSGWAVDADDASQPIDVHFYLDGEAGKGGTMIAGATTGHDRGDGTYTGYSCTLYKSLSAGTHTLYAYGINIGEGDVALIGKKSFTVSTSLASFPDDFKATIINAGSGKLLTASYDGTAKMYSQYANENMSTNKYTWHFIKAADGAYNIYTYYGGKTLEVKGKSDTDGAAILTTKDSTQRWFIVKEGGYYTLRPHYSATRYLDVTGNSQSEGAAIQLNTGNASAAQLFIINNLSNDKTKPAITSMKASDITKDGFKLTINCEDENGVKNVNVVTNTWQGEEYSKTYAATQVSNKVWTVNVKTADFDTYGAFYSKATVYDYAGNSVTSSGLETKAGVYTVSFDANGGIVKADDQMIVYSFKYSTKGTLPVPTRTGYTFNGWYTAKTGGTKVTDSTIVSTAKDHTLYAQWTPASYTVTFDACDGTASAKTQKVTYLSAYGTLPTATRTGYTFTGWYTAKTGGTKITKDTKVNTAKNHTLYAQWTPASYTVTFDACEGTTSAKTQKVTYLSAYGTLPTATKAGYTFNGWYTAKTGGTKITSDTKVSSTKDHTLYAQWTPVSCTVTFNACEGTASAETLEMIYMSAYGTLPTAERKGYIFLGWYTSDAGGTNITSSSLVNTAEDHTLYARWRKEPMEGAGDVNNDGELSLADIVMLQKYLLNIGDLTVMAKGDMSGDGTINVFDLAVLKQIIVNT